MMMGGQDKLLGSSAVICLAPSRRPQLRSDFGFICQRPARRHPPVVIKSQPSDELFVLDETITVEVHSVKQHVCPIVAPVARINFLQYSRKLMPVDSTISISIPPSEGHADPFALLVLVSLLMAIFVQRRLGCGQFARGSRLCSLCKVVPPDQMNLCKCARELLPQHLAKRKANVSRRVAINTTANIRQHEFGCTHLYRGAEHRLELLAQDRRIFLRFSRHITGRVPHPVIAVGHGDAHNGS
mmetsp:Transcript_153053/g.278228  ORF Transcript_153053/g.278228 Transcript_153053/m.278228 type:complete len:242 (+) Transcript_153053:1-726(+)